MSLERFFKPGVVFQDRNGDGFVDFVDAAIVLPDHPTSGQLIAASDVAARLGFETSAMNLPIARASATGASVTIAAAVPGAGLAAGEGVVTAGAPASGKPTIVIQGADDDGLTAAATWFGGHAPLVWDQKGPTIDKVAEDARDFLANHSVTPISVVVHSVSVVQHATSVARVVVDAQLFRIEDLPKAQASLRDLLKANDAQRPLSYARVDAVRVRLSVGATKPVEIDLPRATASVAKAAATAPPGRRPSGANKEDFDLSSFYSNEGALGDSDNNLIPDRVDVLLSPSGGGTSGVVDLAARLGLESTGVSIPIAEPAAAIAAPENQPALVLIGTSHLLVDTLIKEKKWERPALAPGEGLIQLVKKAFGEKSAVIVTGGDELGVARAVDQLAQKFPHLWARGKDRTTLDDVEDDVRKFIAGRTPAGQAAMSLYKLDRIAADLRGKDLASAHVSVYVDSPATGFENLVRAAATAAIKTPALDVTVDDMNVQHAKLLVNDEFDIPSEVDEFWSKLRARVIPVAKHRDVVVEARLSEPPEIRKAVEEQARAELVKAGADPKTTAVTVLSAYKQGYSWLYDAVRPALAGKPVDKITIRFAEIGPLATWTQEGMYVPTRWLLELYPIDEILASELHVDLKKITFEKMPIGSPTYEVVASAADGSDLLHRTFEPAVVERPFFDQFPNYEHVRVTTGWLKADVHGRRVVDERIETDPERFWDHFQAKTLPFLYEHTMKLGKGKPRPEDAPFFGELKVDLTLSEPDYRLPIDQEQIASMEALHEEIYFNTLHFFDLMGRFTRGAPLTYPGRVIPVMHPKADGKAGHAAITLTGFDAPRPSIVVDYVERSGRKGELRLDIPKVAVDRPQTLAALVRAGSDGVARLDLRVKVDTEKDERAALVKRAAEERVDRTIMSAEQVKAVVENLERLRTAGLYRDALAYHDLGALKITAAWEHESKSGAETVATLEKGGDPAPWPDIRKLLPNGWHYAANGAMPATTVPVPASNLVQWDTPIPPREAYEILAKMSTFSEATVYKVGRSYLGTDVWAMDLMPPIAATHWSQAKQTTYKPTIVYSARQHANEVSSTSHTLKLAELLLTDPAYRDKLKKVNLVFHPITNADGAQLAYDLQTITPNQMLHAGYLGPLGVDVTAAQWDPDPIYPESGIRPKIWRTWLPDIFLNPHGYPSHEWVQLFSEYAAWVRTRAVETRDYWTMRGWWMPGFGWLDDARYPRHKDEQFKLLQIITDYAKAAPGTVALNQRAYERYKRYSFDFDDRNFKLDFTSGVLIYKAIKGARANPQSPDFMTRQPNVTIWDGSTEAPDETARGDWMKLVATAGLQWDKAILDYLVQGRHEVERKVEPFWDGVTLSVTRPRPPKPPKADDRKTTSQ